MQYTSGMGNVKNQGHYECPNCSGTEYYSSKETTGAYAVTLDNPGPMDTTSIHTLKRTFVRCSNCQVQMKWIPTAAAIKAKARSTQARLSFTGFFLGIATPVAFFANLWYLEEYVGISYTTLLNSIGIWILAAISVLFSIGFFATGFVNRKLYKAGARNN